MEHILWVIFGLDLLQARKILAVDIRHHRVAGCIYSVSHIKSQLERKKKKKKKKDIRSA